PLRVHGALFVTAGRRAVDVDLLDAVGQIGVLGLESLDVADLLRAEGGDGDRGLRRRAARVAQRVTAVPQRVERVVVVGLRAVDVGRVVGTVGDGRLRARLRLAPLHL